MKKIYMIFWHYFVLLVVAMLSLSTQKERWGWDSVGEKVLKTTII